MPKSFTKPEDLLDVLTEEMKELPTLMLSILISSSKLDGLYQTALNTNLLLPLTVGRLPNFTKIMPSQTELEDMILPVRGATQSFALNAKVTLLLEQIFMYMMGIDSLQPTEALRAAVESGIDARSKVYGIAKGRKGNSEEEEVGKQVLEAASRRLLGLLEVLEISAGKQPQPYEKKRAPIPILSSFGSSLSSPPESDG
jgi:hypothetical protein